MKGDYIKEGRRLPTQFNLSPEKSVSGLSLSDSRIGLLVKPITQSSLL